MIKDEGLKLWEEFLQHNDPWRESDTEGYDTERPFTCFFCAHEEPYHFDSCIFVKAKELVKAENDPERRIKELEEQVKDLIEHTGLDMELDYVPYFTPRVPLDKVVAMLLRHLKIKLTGD